MPLQTGLMLTTVEPELRPKANALAYFVYNLLGFLPGPYIYGIVTDLTGGKESRWGLFAGFMINIPFLTFLVLAWVYKPNLEFELSQRKNEIIDQYLSKNSIKGVAHQLHSIDE